MGRTKQWNFFPLLFLFLFFLGLHGGATKTKTKVTIEVHGLYIVVVELLVRVSEGVLSGVLNMKIRRGGRVLSSVFLTGREISNEWKYTAVPQVRLPLSEEMKSFPIEYVLCVGGVHVYPENCG